MNGQPVAVLVGKRLYRGSQHADQLGDVDVLEMELDPARLDLGEVEFLITRRWSNFLIFPVSFGLVASILAHKLGADTRLTGVVVALVAGSVLLWGDVVLALVPVPLAAGILLFIGAGILDEWLVASRKRLPRADYAILLLIFVTIISLGVPEGVGVGMAITTVFFAVRLARVDSVESEFTARERQSNRSRPIADRAILLAEGERVRAYRLRGYIFFGSAYALAARLRQSLSNDAPPACILLDFGAVSGLDFSAINSLRISSHRRGAYREPRGSRCRIAARTPRRAPARAPVSRRYHRVPVRAARFPRAAGGPRAGVDRPGGIRRRPTFRDGCGEAGRLRFSARGGGPLNRSRPKPTATFAGADRARASLSAKGP